MTHATLHIGIVSSNDKRILVLRKILQGHSSHVIDWEHSSSPLELLNKPSRQAPDLILIDISCNDIDGVAITKDILQQTDSEVLLFSNSVSSDVSKVFEAMGNGALDVFSLVDDHTCNSDELYALIKKIENVGILLKSKVESRRERRKKRSTLSQTNNTLIAIGSSTGGPTALVKVLQKLPKDLNAAIVIIQHVDHQFADTLASWLNEQIDLPVRIACNEDYPEVGSVLLAATNDHLCMHKDLLLYYQREPADYSYRPSVDVFFKSASQYWKGDMLGILLTGMGRDGAIGLQTMRERGIHTIAQDKNSSVVFGMPKAAIDLNAACEILDINAIGDEINRYLRHALHKKRTG